VISRRPERKTEGLVEDERRIDILWERTGWLEMWIFGFEENVVSVLLSLVGVGAESPLEVILDSGMVVIGFL